jgi:cell division protein FtsN
MVAADGRGNGYTLAAGARSAQRDTRRSKAERRSGVSGRNDDAQRKAAPSPTSRSHMQAGIGPVADRGTYAVQVTSERSAAEADTSFRALRAKFPNQLGGREPIVRRTDLGAKGIYYRAMVGPFASMEKAAGMCRTLKAAGGNCLIQRN